MSSADYEIRIIGAPRAPLRDFYYSLRRLGWPATLAIISGGYLLINILFAWCFLVVHGVVNARAGSWLDAFFFSVQTMGTIGYGAMYPASPEANWIVALESMVSMLFTALSTGLVFAKFSLPTARLLFSREATISKMNGVPTLAFRLGNQRSNRIMEAQVRVAMVRTEQTTEGKTFYRMVDLKLERERILSLSRAWIVLHVIDETSPLFGETAESLAKKEVELLVAVGGTDDLWMQSIHATHRYLYPDIAWGKRHVDIITDVPNAIILDLRRFHDLEPAE